MTNRRQFFAALFSAPLVALGWKKRVPVPITDSLVLPPAFVGMTVHVINYAASPVRVYGVGASIDGTSGVLQIP